MASSHTAPGQKMDNLRMWGKPTTNKEKFYMTIVSVDWVGSRQAMAVGEKLLSRQFLVGNAYCHKLTFCPSSGVCDCENWCSHKMMASIVWSLFKSCPDFIHILSKFWPFLVSVGGERLSGPMGQGPIFWLSVGVIKYTGLGGRGPWTHGGQTFDFRKSRDCPTYVQ